MGDENVIGTRGFKCIFKKSLACPLALVSGQPIIALPVDEKSMSAALSSYPIPVTCMSSRWSQNHSARLLDIVLISISLAFRPDSQLYFFAVGMLPLLCKRVYFTFPTCKLAGTHFLFTSVGRNNADYESCSGTQHNELQSRLVPTTLWSWVQCSNQWACAPLCTHRSLYITCWWEEHVSCTLPPPHTSHLHVYWFQGRECQRDL